MLKYKHNSKKEQEMTQNNTQKIVPQDVADFFLSKKALSPKKVQKLVYYAYAWYITLYNQDVNHIDETLFSEEPEAWMHGPVFRSLYNNYKSYGWQEIPKRGSIFPSKTNTIENSLKSFLNDVWEKYGKFSADQLEFMTHQEEPWQKARAGIDPLAPSDAKISKQDIFVFYNKQIS